MATETAAAAATAAVCGDLDEPLLVTPLPKEAPADGGEGAGAGPGPGSRGMSPGAAQADLARHAGGDGGLNGQPAGASGRGVAAPPVPFTGRPLFPSAAHVPVPAAAAGGKPLFPVAGGAAATAGGPATSGVGPGPGPASLGSAGGRPVGQGLFGAAPASFPSSAGGGSSQAGGGSGCSSFSGFGSFPGRLQAAGGGAGGSFESAVLDKMRREAERKRALAEAQADTDL